MEIMRQYRILVVDDDRSILKLVKNVLELDAYDVTTLDRDRRPRADAFCRI